MKPRGRKIATLQVKIEMKLEWEDKREKKELERGFCVEVSIRRLGRRIRHFGLMKHAICPITAYHVRE